MSKNKLSILSTMLLFICTSSGTYENSALQTMMDAWPQVPAEMIRMLTTLPSFISMFVMILVGRVVGVKFRFKTSIMFGLICIATGGLVPFFIHPNWTFILIFRVIQGIGIGFAALGNPLLMRTVDKDQLAKYIGLASVIGSLTNMIINPIVGKLCTLGWHYAFLVNMISIFIFIMTFLFLKEPADIPTTNKLHNKTQLPSTIYLFIMCQFIATLVLYPLLSGISNYLSSLGIQNRTLAGYMLSIYTGGGIISNLLLSKIHRICDCNTLPLACSLVVLGLGLVIFIKAMPFIMIGILLSGIGFTMLMATLQVYIGIISNSAQMARASTLVLASNQCGVFLSTFFITLTSPITLFQSTIANTFFVSLCIYLGLMGFLLVLKTKLIPSIFIKTLK